MTDKIVVHFLVFTSVAIFSIYYLTVSEAISGGDSGELVAEGCILGTAHPPGYPLYTLLIHGVRYIPIGTVAWKVNIMSALFTTVGAICVAYVVKLLGDPDSGSKRFVPGSTLAMGMFSFSPLIWQYAVTAEVFALNTMFAGILLVLTLSFARDRKLRSVFTGAFVAGLALCNQHTIILFEAPLILWILYLLRRDIINKPWLLIQLSMCFLLGFSLYVYLPLAAWLDAKAGSWGHVTTVSGFLHHFLRKDYGTFQLFSGASGKNAEGMIARTTAYARDVFYVQGLCCIPILALLGVSQYRLRSSAGGDEGGEQCRKPGSRSGERSAAPQTIGSRARKADRKGVSTSTSASESSSSPSGADPSESQPRTLLVEPQEAQLTPLAITATFLLYIGVFHSLANLPLGDKLLFGVHQRFWMQPNVILFAAGGVGFNVLVDFLDFLIEDRGKVSAAEADVTTRRRLRSRLKDSATDDSIETRQTDHSPKAFGMVHMAATCVAIATVGYQIHLWGYASNQRGATHFRDYAHALLDPLPENALLLVNYDMQWTAIRYTQMCEGHRKDITAINLSMMTYHWFQHKRHLYPNLTFPGTHHAAHNSASVLRAGAFTMSAFVSKNIKKKNLFLSGKFSFPDPEFSKKFDLVPMGLVSEIIPLKKLPNSTIYARSNTEMWKRVLIALPALPDVNKYPESTWEWTIGRDFKDRVLDTAAFMLQTAIPTAAVDPQPLVDALYWLESALHLETRMHTPTPASSALLKNIGLGHVHLVQCKAKALSREGALPLPTMDLFRTAALIPWPRQSWRDWSSTRFVFAWGEFLRRNDAQQDPQYATMKSMYETATKTVIN